MTFTRLQTADPNLVEQLRAATPAAQRRVAHAVAETAVRHTGLDRPAVNQALTQLREDSRDSGLRDQLARLVEELDERAWDVQEQVEQRRAARESYLTAFAAARAAAAVLAAFDDNPANAALESAYEAQAATGDIAPIRDATQAALSQDHE